MLSSARGTFGEEPIQDGSTKMRGGYPLISRITAFLV
jgi:hypothetical protein